MMLLQEVTLLCILAAHCITSTSIYRDKRQAEPSIIWSCDFEVDICGMKHDVAQVEWRRHNGRTETDLTGPSIDHTFRTNEGHYIYFESSAPTITGDKARILIEMENTDQEHCLIFYYHMYGEGIGTFNVELLTGSSIETVFSITGNQGDIWHNRAINLPSGFYLTFESIKSSRDQPDKGDIGLDDISISAGKCPPQDNITSDITIDVWGCDFEKGSWDDPSDSDGCGISYAGMVQLESDDFDFSRSDKTTPSGHTGPKEGGSDGGYFVYTESSPPHSDLDRDRRSEYATIRSPLFSGNGPFTLSFMYHTRGQLIGGLEVNALNRGLQQIEFFYPKLDMKPSSMWKKALIKLPDGTAAIEFNITLPDDPKFWSSDIALDEILVTKESDALTKPTTRTSHITSTQFTSTGTTQSSADATFLSTSTAPTKTLTTEVSSNASTEVVSIPQLTKTTTTQTLMPATTASQLTNTTTQQPLTLATLTSQRKIISTEAATTLPTTTKKPVTTEEFGEDSSMSILWYCTFETKGWDDVSNKDGCGLGQRGMKQLVTDNFNFTRTNRATPSPHTGPAIGSDGGYYVYTESSPTKNSPDQRNAVAEIQTPNLYSTITKYLSFRYHTRGYLIGTLNVIPISSNSSKLQFEDAISELSMESSKGWKHFEQVKLPEGTAAVIFSVRLPDDERFWSSDIGLDEIYIRYIPVPGMSTLGTTTRSPDADRMRRQVMWYCAFEFPGWDNGLDNNGCGAGQRGMSQILSGHGHSYGDDFDFTRTNRNTPSGHTGPSIGSDGGYFVYTESSPSNTRNDRSNEMAIIRTPTLHGPVIKYLSFKYHTRGRLLGSLNINIVRSQDDPIFFPIPNLNMDSSDRWKSVDDVRLPDGTTNVEFNVTLPNDPSKFWSSDIGLDEIYITYDAELTTKNMLSKTDGSLTTNETSPMEFPTTISTVQSQAEKVNHTVEAFGQTTTTSEPTMGSSSVDIGYLNVTASQTTFRTESSSNQTKQNLTESILATKGPLNVTTKAEITHGPMSTEHSSVTRDSFNASTKTEITHGPMSTEQSLVTRDSLNDTAKAKITHGPISTEPSLVTRDSFNASATAEITHGPISTHASSVTEDSSNATVIPVSTEPTISSTDPHSTTYIPTSIARSVSNKTVSGEMKLTTGSTSESVTSALPTIQPGTTEQQTVTAESSHINQFYCDFEHGICGLVGGKYSNFTWTRQSGSTPSKSTGPLGDNTYRCGSYMYVEASTPRIKGDIAILETPVMYHVSEQTPACLRMFYYMFGADIGTLSVRASDGTVLFSKSDEVGDEWIELKIQLPPGTYSILIQGEVGNGYRGDIAIDDLSILSGYCNNLNGTINMTEHSVKPRNPDELFRCSFEEGETDCEQLNIRKDAARGSQTWRIGSGESDFKNTGPSRDATFDTCIGHYIYTDTMSGTLFNLTLPTFTENTILHFKYHMYGAHIGTLKVISGIGAAQQKVWHKSGNSGDNWIQKSGRFMANVQVYIIAETSWESFGEIAIDDLIIKRVIT
ncbi:unnamed protein product [Owenia fusiformis]|uniref:MAM domain-containing protein n=1 Tax=Owenia fusiformis TaxID=6347 RepID=A0A8S4NG48_OWEFU|nr:unnamed protein product [Owenia fusiformis]